MARIYYRAISQYASDHGIGGDHFAQFVILVGAMDEEYLAWASERAKEDEEKRKRDRERQ